jgi:hypothetical protein
LVFQKHIHAMKIINLKLFESSKNLVRQI